MSFFHTFQTFLLVSMRVIKNCKQTLLHWYGLHYTQHSGSQSKPMISTPEQELGLKTSSATALLLRWHYRVCVILDRAASMYLKSGIQAFAKGCLQNRACCVLSESQTLLWLSAWGSVLQSHHQNRLKCFVLFLQNNACGEGEVKYLFLPKNQGIFQ